MGAKTQSDHFKKTLQLCLCIWSETYCLVIEFRNNYVQFLNCSDNRLFTTIIIELIVSVVLLLNNRSNKLLHKVKTRYKAQTINFNDKDKRRYTTPYQGYGMVGQ